MTTCLFASTPPRRLLTLSFLFTDLLLTRKLERGALCLPSPEELKRKIIIKVWEGAGRWGDGWKEIALLPSAASRVQLTDARSP